MRPTNRKPSGPDDAGFVKSQLRQSVSGQFGIVLYETFSEAMRGRNIRCPSFSEQTDMNVLKAVGDAGAFWEPTGCSLDEIVHTYLRTYTGRAAHVKFQNLVGRGKAELLMLIHRERKSAQISMGGEAMINEADRACADLGIQTEVELALDYLRAILKAQTGDRSMTPAGVVFCRGLLGNVPAWVRCFATNNDRVVVEQHGGEAAGTFKRHPQILRYLEKTYNYNAIALATHD